MAPLLGSLGLDYEIGRVFAVLAIGAGSAVASHANDSFFWVMTQMSNMNVNQGVKVQTVGSTILGLSAILFLAFLHLFF
jgi:gluconate:H+ symporter, GntP family